MVVDGETENKTSDGPRYTNRGLRERGSKKSQKGKGKSKKKCFIATKRNGSFVEGVNNRFGQVR